MCLDDHTVFSSAIAGEARHDLFCVLTAYKSGISWRRDSGQLGVFQTTVVVVGFT